MVFFTGIIVAMLFQKNSLPATTVAYTTTEVRWDEADKYYGQTVTITGKIVSTHNSGKTCFLNFHQNWKKYFTAVIFASDFSKFPPNPENYYLNKEVKITGFVKEYQGKPEIILKDPGQIVIATGRWVDAGPVPTKAKQPRYEFIPIGPAPQSGARRQNDTLVSENHEDRLSNTEQQNRQLQEELRQQQQEIEELKRQQEEQENTCPRCGSPYGFFKCTCEHCGAKGCSQCIPTILVRNRSTNRSTEHTLCESCLQESGIYKDELGRFNWP